MESPLQFVLIAIGRVANNEKVSKKGTYHEAGQL